MIYDHVFAPFTIADGRCVVAPESEWNAPRSGRVLIDCDLFAEWEGHLVDQSGLVLHKSFLAWMRMEPLTLSDVRRRVFAMIDASPGVEWLVRTEMPENVVNMLPTCKQCETVGRTIANCSHCGGDGRCLTQRNLWLGATIRTQADADARIPQLLGIPAARRWLDVVPGESIRLGRFLYPCGCGGVCDSGMPCPMAENKAKLDLVRVRGESSPVHPAWVRTLRDQCGEAGVAFWFETWGDWAHTPHGFECRTQADNWFLKPDGTRCHDGSSKRSACMSRVGRERSGRQLDGREWSEVPA